jgi:putative ABC transport system permease protein
MGIKQYFSLALKSLRTSKMHSFLTMLGIIIGVTAVIVLVSLIGGMSSEITAQFEGMGTNLITVNLMGRGNSNRTVSVAEMENLVWEHPELFSAMSPTVSVNSTTIKYGTDTTTSSCLGVNEYYDDIRNYKVDQGRFLSYNDVNQRKKVCLIGSYQWQELFGGGEALGETIKINGEPFQVIGILTEKDDSSEGSSDDMVMLPYTTARSLGAYARVSSYCFSAADGSLVDQCMNQLERTLYQAYNSTDAYRVTSQAEMLEQMNELTGTMSLVLVGVAGISLLVGGIGIMNIMLVSVTERIREIGIRKSLGAKKRDIMGQFLIESATTSACGGIIGILTGIALAYSCGYLFDMAIAPSASAIMLAFSVSVLIGILFGYLPANKAAKLIPIEALRQQ